MTETLRAGVPPGVLRRPVVPARVVAASAGALSAAVAVTSLVLHARYAALWPAELDPFWRSAIVWGLAVGPPGALLAWRRPDNRVGWLVLASGLLLALSEMGFAWTVVALGAGVELWWHPAVMWLAAWVWVPGYVMLPTLVLLLTPEGTLPSRRWRAVAVLDVVAIVVGTVGFALAPWDRVEPPVTWMGLRNPVAVPGAERLLTVGLPLLGLGAATSVAAVVARLRRGSPPERQQLKWVLLGASLSLVVGASAFATPASGLAQWLAALAVVPLVACTTVAVLRHRLWDVEAFIARSAVYAVLTLAVVAAYLALVAMVGSRLGRGGSIVLAVVLVAVGLEPARTALQRQVNRLLYGQRDDPYAVLSALGQRLEGAAAAEPGGEGLPGVARTVAEALRLPYAGVVVDGELVSSHGQRPAAVETVALAHRGVAVGELEVGVRRGEAHIGDDDRRVLTDLARHLAGAANSLLLTRDLVESRQAIVTAREEERHRLHRDLHDDLGPALAALVLQLETAGDLVARDPAAAEALLRRLSGHAREAVDVTRRIVADLRPPTLDELGLLGALRELAERFSSPALTVTADLEDPGRLPAAVDVVLLRVAAEALANMARHSGAHTCTLTLTAREDEVTLEVIDDGRGVRSGEPAGVGLGSIADRVAEVGGRSSIVAGDAGGTRVSVTLPRPG